MADVAFHHLANMLTTGCEHEREHGECRLCDMIRREFNLEVSRRQRPKGNKSARNKRR